VGWKDLISAALRLATKHVDADFKIKDKKIQVTFSIG